MVGNKPELIVLMGPPGSGKTTFCRSQLSAFVRISQDDQGKQHAQDFDLALERGQDIVIDRMNNTASQREAYIAPARAKGYHVTVVRLETSFQVCLKNLLNRSDHPTLNSSDPAIRKVLCSYFNQYHRPSSSEYDTFTTPSGWMMANLLKPIYDSCLPHTLDISHECRNKRVIIVGDVHGMYDCLRRLLDQVKFDVYKDILILAGDLVDRGPQIKETLEFAMNTPNVYCVLSNHDDRLRRYMAGNKVKTTHMADTLAQIGDLVKSDSLLSFLYDMPWIIKWDTNKYVVHAGIDPAKPMTEQAKDILTHIRNYVPETGQMVSLADEQAGTVKSVPWYTVKPVEDVKIWFGHNNLPNWNVSDYAIALDGGACFGNVLRAWVGGEIVEVPAEVASLDLAK